MFQMVVRKRAPVGDTLIGRHSQAASKISSSDNQNRKQ